MTTRNATRNRLTWILGGLVLAVVLVVAAALFGSRDPDGLERVAADRGFADAAEESRFQLIADYVFPGLGEPAGTIAAGLIGVAAVFAVAWIVGRLLARRRAAGR